VASGRPSLPAEPTTQRGLMQPDVEALRDFYATPLGQVARRLLAQRIRARWPHLPGGTLMGMGFPTPYLGSFRGEVSRLGALMPVGQGALVWPPTGSVLSVLVENEQLPLPDNSVDRILAVHCLETAERAGPLLREMWRALAPEGRVLIIVPNRRGVWARIDATPFGQGQPYSRGQLERLLSDALFTPLDWSMALFLPPLDQRMLLRSATALERLGNRISPAFAGVIIVEARKEMVAPIGRAATSRRFRDLMPVRGGSGALHGRHKDESAGRNGSQAARSSPAGDP
jgi:SAM-dependent methyltransferase